MIDKAFQNWIKKARRREWLYERVCICGNQDLSEGNGAEMESRYFVEAYKALAGIYPAERQQYFAAFREEQNKEAVEALFPDKDDYWLASFLTTLTTDEVDMLEKALSEPIYDTSLVLVEFYASLPEARLNALQEYLAKKI